MRVLFAWEMGHNYGHASQIGMVAEALHKRGAQIWLALKNPGAGLELGWNFPCRILQAPYHPLKAGRRGPPSLTYAEGLAPCGYDSADHLYPLIEAWRSLYDLVKPDALVVQAAPTALLAARGVKFKRFAFGKSFDMPPATTPMQPFYYWKKNDLDAIKRREVAMTGIINQALARARMKPIKRFCDILEADKNFLAVFKELDHYPHRENADYLGGLYESGSGAKIDWKNKGGRRIFAYMRPGPPVFGACLEALCRLPAGYDALLAAPGMPEDIRKKMETPSLRIVSGPVRLEALLPSCELLINHASAGLCCATAMAGVPMLMLPLHVEQLMFARAVGRAGIGRALVGKVEPQHIGDKITAMLGDPSFKANADKMAANYKGFTPEKLAKSVADEIYGKRK